MIILLILLTIILFIVIFKMKKFKYGNLVVVTGGVKTGKTMLSLNIAIKEYRKRLFKWKLKQLIHKHNRVERPLFYSNIPLKLNGYVQLTDELIKREHRFVYNSVVFMDEATLVADSMLGASTKNDLENCRLTLLCKLIAHETKGGCLVVNTQATSDLHYSFKKCLNNYLYIHHQIKIPFFVIMSVEEMAYSYDNSTINNRDTDIEKNLKWLIVSKRIWKKYDRYCYSKLTDNLPVDNKQLPKATDLKTDYVGSVNKSILERAKEGKYRTKE